MIHFIREIFVELDTFSSSYTNYGVTFIDSNMDQWSKMQGEEMMERL